MKGKNNKTSLAGHLLALQDLDSAEIGQLLQRAGSIQNSEGLESQPLSGQVWGLLFLKNSTRTRVSFEVAIRRLGGNSLYLDSQTLQLGRGETWKDTGKVLAGYLDGMVVRTYGQEDLVDLASVVDIPIINALTDLWHPCQILADMLTVQNEFGKVEGTRWTYLGDGNNIARTLVMGAALCGYELVLAGPKKYWVNESILNQAKSLNPNVSITSTEDAKEAVRGSQVLCTDTWLSMGDKETEANLRKKDLGPYQLNAVLMKAAEPKAIALHCLPAHRGEEITDDIMDGPQSRIWAQAKNRLPVQQALLELLARGHKGK